MATEAEPITIVLADDHAVVRSGLRMVLERAGGFEVVSEAGDAESALRTVLGHKPAILVLDLNMPGELSSLDAIPRVQEVSPNTHVVILTMQEDPEFARRALRAGAAGYVLKEAADDELVDALRAGGGGRPLPHPATGGGPRRRAARAVGPSGRPHRARGRGPAADRPGPHQRRDRSGALTLGPHGRVASGAHPAEAQSLHPRRARALRAGPRVRQDGLAGSGEGQLGPDHRSGVGAGQHRELAARELDALAHAGQPEAVVRDRLRVEVEADAVIGHGHVHLVAGAAHRDVDAGGAGVLDDVGERLL